MKLFIITVLVAVATAVPYSYYNDRYYHPYRLDHNARTIKQSSNVNPDGSYSYEYQTDNGIYGSQSGVGGYYAQGASAWVAPDGTPVQFSYIADENGYQPTGTHIPQTPPHVLRLLDYIRTHPQTKNY